MYAPTWTCVLPVAEVASLGLSLCAGLGAVHEAGIVHRDFKPENVMLTRAGRVVVMDFGLAKARTSGRTGTISGTPAYMAPEQARGDSLDARADVFAAGVVLAEMLSVGGSEHQSSRQSLNQSSRQLRQCQLRHQQKYQLMLISTTLNLLRISLC